MPATTPEGRALSARLASHESWAQTTDRAARTAPGRQAALDRFEQQVDPNGELDPHVRAQMAESARKAYFTRLAYRSARARARRQERAARQATGDGGDAE